jgi:ADP-ribose pyrophosphatase YjhB (NUDIX family)
MTTETRKPGCRTLRVPFGDSHERPVCDDCGHVEYKNPRIIASLLPVTDDGRILLCRRAIEPRKGFWTIPGGNQEIGETMADAALREAFEEGGIAAVVTRRLAEYEVLQMGQIHMHFEGRITDLHAGIPHFETLETKLFGLDEIPWDELAFPSNTLTLQLYGQLVAGEEIALPVCKVLLPYDAAKKAEAAPGPAV